MKRTLKNTRRSREAGYLLPAIGVAAACLLSFVLAEIPAWWGSRGLVKKDATGQPVEASDFAAANQGQLKNVAIAAYEEFFSNIPAGLGGLGPVNPPPNPGQPESPANRASPAWRIRQMLAQWVVLNPDGTIQRVAGKPVLAPGATAQKDFAAITQGQMKAVAAPFYDRLAEVFWSYNSGTPSTSQIDPAWAKPWTDAPDGDNNHAMANLGQLKRIFSLDLHSDADSDGLTNLAEMLANKARNSTDPLKWTDLGNAYSSGGVLTDGDQVGMGLDPTNPVNGQPPDAPTGLHITFRDATVHPLDPDLSKINVEWSAPARSDVTVALSSTYAGATGDWVPVPFSGSKSGDITVPYSKRVYQYRVTVTAPNQLTASTDIAYELPVIRGIMTRSVKTTSQFTGVLLYDDKNKQGVPRKFKRYTRDWNYDYSSLDKRVGSQSSYYWHIDGSYERSIYLATNTEYASSYQDETSTTDDGSTGSNLTFVASRSLPAPASSASLANSQVANGSGSVSSYYDVWSATGANSNYFTDTTDDTSYSLTLNPFPIKNALGIFQPSLPFANYTGYTGSDTLEASNVSVLTKEGNLVPGDLSWSIAGTLQQDATGQFGTWVGTATNSPYGLPGYTEERQYGEAERYQAGEIIAWPEKFYLSGLGGPRIGSAGFDYPTQGDEYPSTPTTDTSDPSQVRWTRSYNDISHPYGSQTTDTATWRETVTVSSPTTTDEWVSSIASNIGPPSPVSWYVPGSTDAGYATQYAYTNKMEATYYVSPKAWYPTEWEIRADYATAAPSDLVTAGYPVDGYVTVPPNISGLVGQYSLPYEEEDYCQLLSSEYKFRIYPPAESCQIQWLETFIPDSTGEKQYKVRNSDLFTLQTSDTSVNAVNRTDGFSSPDSTPGLAGAHSANPNESFVGLRGVVNLFLPNIEVLSPKLNALGSEIEGAQAGLESVNALKVAGWLDKGAYRPDGRDVIADFIENDRDRFYIRVPNLSGTVPVVKISTTNIDSDYDDGPCPVLIEPELGNLGNYRSKSHILVSDKIDDEYSANGAGVDKQIGDRTHLCAALAKIRVDWQLNPGLAPITREIRLYPRNTRSYPLVYVDIDVFIVRDKPERDGGIEPISKLDIRHEFSDKIQPRFLQANICPRAHSIEIIDPPPGVNLSSGLVRDKNTVSPMVKEIIDGSKGVVRDRICLYYIKRFRPGGPTEGVTRGWSIPDWNYKKTAERPYTHNAFIASHPGDFVSAHELGHIMGQRHTVRDHDDSNNAVNNLMYIAPFEKNEDVKYCKRLNRWQWKYMHDYLRGIKTILL